MRLAISGSHGTGKSTLIESFLAKCPHYAYEPEAFETIGDDIVLTSSGGPDVDGLTALLDLTFAVLAGYLPGTRVIFERSPVDYLAYAAADPTLTTAERLAFLRTHTDVVRTSVRHLDVIFLLPVSPQICARREDDEEFRNRVDRELRDALIYDQYNLFDDDEAPLVFDLSPSPDLQLSELMRRLVDANNASP